ncbi:SRPBCC family protein [Afipia sp. 1NLS2]|uniref:SRPBCC family protein n=1 Tax=Afipia sp. 1NLS2 TaxID=666684 RepID=UPI0001DA1012|nr:SRPBCC family protein [Afipia sp. 1NLS2]EFI52733.1 Activator of Hsp90 ATPase 1 family protein [Afipia sp. 1NLS2]
MEENDLRIGSIKCLGDSFVAQIKRVFDHEQNVVWHMLTEPQALVQWLAPGSIDLRLGGVVHIDFADSGTVIDSTVLEFDPPSLLAYSWSNDDEPERRLRWELRAVETQTQLLLTISLPVTEDIAKACAGFDAHLEMLAAALENVPIRFPVNYFLDRRRAYAALQQK